MLCVGCGNEIEPGSACLICEDRELLRLHRRLQPVEEEPRWEDERRSERLTLCPGCGHEIRSGSDCDFCAETVDEDSEVSAPTSQTNAMLCVGCGNEIEPGSVCVFCEDRERLRRRREPADDDWRWEEQRRGERLTLCPVCGHEMRPGFDCDFCVVAADEDSGVSTRFCSGCGNVVHGEGDCGVCSAGRGARKRTKLSLCPNCGNEVEDIHRCPICLDGRATGATRKKERDTVCPSCDEELESQRWDGVEVRMCASCQGCLFPPGGLETTLDKLRHTPEAADVRARVEELRKRLDARLPRNVRYKPCPLCGLSMTRRAFKRVSGIIIDVCGRHGTWVDQSTFGQLTEFMTRGGDTFAADRSR